MKTSSSSNLKKHVRAVHEEHQTICKFCSKPFKNPRYLRQHIRLLHETSSHGSITCQSGGSLGCGVYLRQATSFTLDICRYFFSVGGAAGVLDSMESILGSASPGGFHGIARCAQSGSSRTKENDAPYSSTLGDGVHLAATPLTAG